MLSDIKLAALLQKGRYGDPAVMSADRVLEMSTIDGAEAIGMAHRIDLLKAGKRADITLIDVTNTGVH
ncbi:amidohydrolase family protein [Mycolicibacterium fortuitum]